MGTGNDRGFVGRNSSSPSYMNPAMLSILITLTNCSGALKMVWNIS